MTRRFCLPAAAALITGLTLAASLATPASARWTEDADVCAGGVTDVAVTLAACTRAIDSGALTAIEKARTFHNRGIARVRGGDLPRAITDFTEAIKLDPKKPAHYFARAEASMARNQNTQAIADFETALRLDGPSVQGYYSLGMAQMASGDPNAAVASYSEAIRIAPREVAVLNERANAYFAKRDWDHALADYTAAIANDPRNPVLFHNRGEVWRIVNDYPRARQDLDSAIKLKPDYDSAYVRRGLVRVAERNYKDALADFDKAVRINPNSPGNLAARGVARFYAGRYAEAETDLAASAAIDPRNQYGTLWLYLARAHQNKDGSATLRDQARLFNLNVFPGPVIRYYLGEVNADEVMQAVQKGTEYERRTQLCEASYYLGEAALLRGNRGEAVRLFRQAVGVGLTHLYEHQGAMVELQRLGL